MRGRGAVALLAAAAFALAACGTPRPSSGAPRSIFMSLKGQGAELMTLEVADRSGIVSNAVQRRDADLVALAPADAATMDRAGLVVRALPSGNGLLVDWTSGACDTQQRLTIARGGGGPLSVVLDRGAPSDPVCDATLLRWEVAISTLDPVDAATAIATTVPSAAP